MTREEDLIRATARIIASTVHDVPPLRLEPARARNRRTRPWVAPLAAAVTIAVVAVSLVIARHIENGPGAPEGAAASTARRAVPEYYASVAPYSPRKPVPPRGLVLADTVTGRTVATVAPPAGVSFVGLSAAADDRTWVAYARHIGDGSVGSWYLLRLAPGAAHPVRLTALPIKPLADVGSMALSASGRELAVVRLTGPSGKRTLEIYSVTTGRLLRDWTTADTSVLAGSLAGLSGLNWIDSDRAITFPVTLYSRARRDFTLEAVRSVDVGGPSGDLIADSRVIWSPTAARAPGPLSCPHDPVPVVSADGTTLSCVSWIAVSGSSRPKTQLWRLTWLTYPTTAQPGRGVRGATIDYQITVTAAVGQSSIPVGALWVNTTGGTMLGVWLVGLSYTPGGFHLGVIRDGTFTPLPVPVGLQAQQGLPVW